ncbi:MAG: DegT/DnrJ/EryC1/StrS family aminotransferase [Rhodothermales bacterium]|nr:DegT/DnrJ/EryC1/StrS family aminotransferase [Rhodothermales bacterium]
MVDLRGQYDRIRDEINDAIREVIEQTAFIGGPAVERFSRAFSEYLDGLNVVPCANGTDAIQIALMALGVGQGDEVITPSFTFVATAEAAALLGATPVFADIEADTFNIDPTALEPLITDRTKAIVPVHLFGQTASMDPILEIADRHGIPVVEDAAQAVGARYGTRVAGSMGAFGTISFFPSKNLGAYGDAGAVLSADPARAATARLIANHGSSKKYHNEIVGVNSRLDAVQAAVLRVKLGYLDSYTRARVEAADRYDQLLGDLDGIRIPVRANDRTHVFHQYTIRVRDGREARDSLAEHLKDAGIPFGIYYPVPMHRLPVFAGESAPSRHGPMDETERAADQVLSLPMHSELTEDQQRRITDSIRGFFGASGR